MRWWHRLNPAGILAALLERCLGAVARLELEDRSDGCWTLIKFCDLSPAVDATHHPNLPLELAAAHISTLVIAVPPWRQLRRAGIDVRVDGVSLLAGLQRPREWSDEAQRRHKAARDAAHAAAVAAAEHLLSGSLPRPTSASLLSELVGDGVRGRLLRAALSSASVRATRLAICLEDSSLSGPPFALSLQADCILVEPAPSRGDPSDASPSDASPSDASPSDASPSDASPSFPSDGSAVDASRPSSDPALPATSRPAGCGHVPGTQSRTVPRHRLS